MVNATLSAEQQTGVNVVLAWVRERQRRGCAVELFCAALALAAGVAALFVTFCCFWFACLVIAPIMMMHASVWWPLAVTVLACGVMLVDSVYSRRDDLSNVTLWLLRETIGLGPRLLVETVRGVRRADRLAAVDAHACAEVLAYLAGLTRSTGIDDLRRVFPHLVWTRLGQDLGLFPGVLFLRADLSRVTLTEPLRLYLRRLLGPQHRYHPQPEPEPEPQRQRQRAAEPPPKVEPENLSPHEILGVSLTATWAEIRSAYRTRIKECHPDRFVELDPASRQMAEEWTKSLNAAYAALAASKGRVR